MASEHPTDTAGRGYSTQADYWLRTQKPEFDEYLAGTMGATVWISVVRTDCGRTQVEEKDLCAEDMQECEVCRAGYMNRYDPIDAILFFGVQSSIVRRSLRKLGRR